MKHLIATIALSLCACVLLAQADRAVLDPHIASTSGDWDGFFEYSIEDSRGHETMPAKCTSKWDGNKWVLEVQYDEGEGMITGVEVEADFSEDGKTVIYNEIPWNVIEFSQSGDTLNFTIEIIGKEKRRILSTRHTFLITSTTFFITETTKYDDEKEYTFRNKHLFRRKKA